MICLHCQASALYFVARKADKGKVAARGAYCFTHAEQLEATAKEPLWIVRIARAK